MLYFGTVRNQGQPGEIRTQSTEDLRAAIGALFSEAQTAVFRGGNVDATVWWESGDLKTAPSIPVVNIKVNASKLPSLLLAPMSGGNQLSLGDGKERTSPPIVACAYCEGVADLVDAGELVWRYRCAGCGFESTYSPSQVIAWLGKSLIRSDRTRLALPTGLYGNDNRVPLASYLEDDGTIKLITIRDANYPSRLSVHNAKGEESLSIDTCRRAHSLADAHSLAKEWLRLGQAGSVEYHDPHMASATATELWLSIPKAVTNMANLPKDTRYGRVIVGVQDGYVGYAWDFDPTAETVDIGSKSYPMSEVVQVERALSPEDYGKTVERAIIFYREGWTPPAPDGKPAKTKGKKDAATETETKRVAVAVEPIEELEAWEDVLLDDPDVEADDVKEHLQTEVSSVIENADADVDPALLERCRQAYPGVDPVAYKSKIVDPDGGK